MGQLGPRMSPPHNTSHPPQHTNTSFRSSLNQPLKYSHPTSQIPQRTTQISQPISQITHTQPLESWFQSLVRVVDSGKSSIPPSFPFTEVSPISPRDVCPPLSPGPRQNTCLGHKSPGHDLRIQVHFRVLWSPHFEHVFHG